MLARMTSSLPVARLAVLIDGDNVSHKQAQTVFALASRLGKVREARVYCNLAHASSWDEAAARHALELRHSPVTSKGKNASDMALVIDAMDLLLRDGEIEGFCIVSSDGDFIGLAKRIRREGRRVFGLGRASAPKLYKSACDDFLCLDSAKPVEKAKASVASASVQPHPALAAIRAVLDESESRDGWYCLAAFGSRARRAGVDPKRFGAKKLIDLLRATGQYEIEPGKQPRRFRPVILRAVGA
jgi:hypothetical protein